MCALHSLQFQRTTSVFSCRLPSTVTGLVLNYESLTSVSRIIPNDEWITNDSSCMTECFLSLSLSLSAMLRPMVSRPVCLGIKHPCEAYDQFFITLREFRVCWCGAFSLTRGRVCRLQFLLVLTRAVFLGSESRGTRDHILLSQIQDFLFCRLLRLARLRWRYSTPSSYGINAFSVSQSYFTTGGMPPISSSWRRAPWDSWPEFFSQLNTCGHSPYITSSLTRGWVCNL
jgi:hypothetical protein